MIGPRSLVVLVLVTIMSWAGAAQAQPTGSEGGPCYGNSTCDKGLSCDPAAKTCVSQLPTGTLQGPCWGNGTCNDGLSCHPTRQICVARRPTGTHNGPCYPNKTCNSGFSCDKGLGICKPPEKKKPAPTSPKQPTPAPTSPKQPTAAPTPAPTTPQAGAACYPPCRAGFFCHAGRCVSRCNPPCPAGQMCTAHGQCAFPAGAGMLGAGVASNKKVSPGWASGAGVFGYISTVIIAALTVGTIAAGEDGIPPGAVATFYAAISLPIVAVGGKSARTHPDVTGHSGLRTAGWIGYGITMLDALFLLGIAIADGEVAEGHIASVGALGTLSMLAFSMDARSAAKQARAIRAAQRKGAQSKRRITPHIGVVRGFGGEAVGTFGLRTSF